MRFGRLMLAGDAAHVVPPTGAKGLNLAASDIHYMYDAILGFLQDHDAAALDEYSRRALARVWKAERFAWWLTTLTHRFNDDPFEQRMKEAELAYITTSDAGRQMVAENYVGLPL
jgi:p-hydroxybenzoate 3-monooxygenase